MIELPVDEISYTAPDDGAHWVFTAGLDVWSVPHTRRYLLDEDFRAIYPDAPR